MGGRGSESGGSEGYDTISMNKTDIPSYVEDKTGGNIYARAVDISGSFNEERFLDSRSVDEFVVEEPHSLEEAKELVEKYDLPGEATEYEGVFGAGYAVRYDGVNAVQGYFDETNMGHQNTIVIFEGKYLGENLQGDGDIIKPDKILEVIRIKNKK